MTTAGIITPEEALLLERDMQARASFRPSDLYIPGSAERYPNPRDRYQLEFHKSTHVYRLLVLGNGAGKTTTAGVECDWWLQGTHPHQWTPPPPINAVWVCQDYKQFKLQRPQFEKRFFTKGFSWNEQYHCYTWANGSTLTILSNDGEWTAAQGIPPEIVFGDEEFNDQLWTELRMRRRADTQTRFVISATATQGKRWMYRDLYVPWLEHHKALGLTEDQAMKVQSHEYYWVWPKGSVLDNPVATIKDKEHYELVWKYKSAAERAARLGGGFHDFNQQPVFNSEAIAEQEAAIEKHYAAGRTGIQGCLVDPGGTQPGALIQLDGKWFNHPDFPSFRQRFQFHETGAPWLNGRLVIYEMPRPDVNYVMGMDFAQGLEGKDADTAMVCRPEGERLIEVAEAEGRWGQTIAPVVFFMLGMYYNEALATGEANSMGMAALRTMWELGYLYMYMRDDKEDARGAIPKKDRLGYYKGSQLQVTLLQQAIAPFQLTASTDDKPGEVVRLPSRIVLRSREAIKQHRQFEHRPRSKRKSMEEARDSDVVMGAPSGGFDDLVSAAAGCVLGMRDLPKFIKPDPVFPRGTLGEKLGHNAETQAGKKTGAFKYAKR